jgi:serine/threonine protein kinase
MLLNQKYDLKETLGTGAFSEVKKAINKENGDQVAIKIIDRQKCAGKENMIQSEISILQKVKHENIVQLYELFETKDKIYLVMEL